MRILVVEDDALISNAIEAGLKSKAYAVDCLNDGNQALYAPEDIAYDCILLDLGLPGIDGVQLLKKWRANNVRTPVIIITARDGIDDRVQGLDIGADDYVVKPFDLTELLARIRAVTRRTASSNDVVTLSNGVLSLDPISHEVLVKDENGSVTNQPLTSREYALLEALLSETLEDKIYAFGQEVESNAIEFIIHNLRKKVGSQNIKNVRGVGWKVVKES